MRDLACATDCPRSPDAPARGRYRGAGRLSRPRVGLCAGRRRPVRRRPRRGAGKRRARHAGSTLSGTFSAVEIYGSICERRYDYDAKSQIVPMLAAALSTVSADRRTYTIPLRKGILFNDGAPFNAQAVVTTLHRMMELPGSTRASDYGPIDRLSAPNPYTVVIRLSSRNSVPTSARARTASAPSCSTTASSARNVKVAGRA